MENLKLQETIFKSIHESLFSLTLAISLEVQYPSPKLSGRKFGTEIGSYFGESVLGMIGSLVAFEFDATDFY